MDFIAFVIGLVAICIAMRRDRKLLLVIGIGFLIIGFPRVWVHDFQKSLQNRVTDQEIMAALEPVAFQQKEFPQGKVIELMRSCLQTERMRERASYQVGKSVEFCTCFTEKRVHRFTLREQFEASNANWDMKIVPFALKKYTDIETECTQSTLQ